MVIDFGLRIWKISKSHTICVNKSLSMYVLKLSIYLIWIIVDKSEIKDFFRTLTRILKLWNPIYIFLSSICRVICFISLNLDNALLFLFYHRLFNKDELEKIKRTTLADIIVNVTGLDMSQLQSDVFTIRGKYFCWYWFITQHTFKTYDMWIICP